MFDDDTNGFGYIPDSLPPSYGYKDRDPSTVHQNAVTSSLTNPFNPIGTAQLVPANPARPQIRPTYNGAMPAGQVQMRNAHQAPVISYSQLVADEDDDDDDDYGPYGAADKGPPIKKDAFGEKYREYLGQGGWLYAQYENGKYAILDYGLDSRTKKKVNKLPSGVKLKQAFDASANQNAFEQIEAEVEAAIGPFPKGAKVKAAKAAKKGKGNKSGGGGGAAAIAEAIARGATTAIVDKKKGFQPSDADTTPAVSEEPPGGGGGDDTTETGESWFSRSSLGVPNWGWVVGGVLLTGGVAIWALSGPKKKAEPQAGG
jgi:hypothetical protein